MLDTDYDIFSNPSISSLFAQLSFKYLVLRLLCFLRLVFNTDRVGVIARVIRAHSLMIQLKVAYDRIKGRLSKLEAKGEELNNFKVMESKVVIGLLYGF